MSTAERLGIVAAFEAAWQRKATPEEAERLHRVQSVLGVKDNDAIMILMVALEHYQGLYSEMPARIEDASRTAVREAKETAERLANTAAQLAHNDLVERMGDAVNQVATSTARTQQWKAFGLGIATAAITLLITGWLAFQQGKEAGAGEAYAVARHEAAAASWANTPEGQLAYRLALVGSLQQVARCTLPGWKVSNGACLPFSASDGTLHGWAIP
jgi:hypothetical protein